MDVNMNTNVSILSHPLIQHKLTLLRDKTTGGKEFREIVGEIAMLMCYETTRDLPLQEVEIETPVAMAKAHVISGKKTGICPYSSRGTVVWLRACSGLFLPLRWGISAFTVTQKALPQLIITVNFPQTSATVR